MAPPGPFTYPSHAPDRHKAPTRGRHSLQLRQGDRAWPRPVSPTVSRPATRGSIPPSVGPGRVASMPSPAPLAMNAESPPPSSAQSLRPAHRPAFAPTARSAVTKREASASGTQSTGQGRGLPDPPDEANGAPGARRPITDLGPPPVSRWARRQLGVPPRRLGEGRVFRMPIAHRRRPLHGLQPIEVRQSGEEVARLRGEDRERVPGTRFLRHFEVGDGPDPALLPLPQVCDRHRRRLKQGARH